MLYEKPPEIIVAEGYRLTTISVCYHLPDYRDLLGEFIWQTLDVPPDCPRIMCFLEWWEKKIEGKIHSVRITWSDNLLAHSRVNIISRSFKLH